jgi:nucleotide-binding universal stress UspA family protein
MGLLRSILLATDFRQSSQEAAGATVQLAATFGARVTVLHVREEFLTWPVSPFENQDRLTQQLAAQKVKWPSSSSAPARRRTRSSVRPGNSTPTCS